MFLTFLVTLLSQQSLATSGVQFVPEGSVYAAYSGWVVSFTIDLAPYRQLLHDTRVELDRLQADVEYLLQTPINNVSAKVQLALTHVRAKYGPAIELEINKVSLELRYVEDIMGNIELVGIHRRPKRAVLPIIGEVLSVLFGVASENDIAKLKRGLVQLGRGQIAIAHVVLDSLTLVNKTNIEVKRNRQLLNQLTNSLGQLRGQVQDIITNITSKIYPSIISQEIVQNILHSIKLVSDAVRNAKLAVQVLQDNLHETMQGKVSSKMILPRVLRSVLLGIQKELPPDLSLPVDPRKQLSWYYNNLAAALLPDRTRFHAVTLVPLVEGQALFSIYRVIQVPVPHAAHLQAAEYVLSDTHFAVAPTGGHYTTLNDLEASSCIKTDIGYCAFLKPLSSLTNMPSCLSVLFLQEAKLISKLCPVKVSIVQNYPLVRYLFGATWLISTPLDVTFHIACTQTRSRVDLKTIHIQRGVMLLNLGEGCTGFNDFVNLPAYTIKRSSKVITNVFNQTAIKLDKLPNIWTVFGNYNNNNFGSDSVYASPSGLPNISDNSEILQDMKNRMNSLENGINISWSGMEMTHQTTYIVIGIVILVLVAIFVIWFKIRQNRKRKSNYEVKFDKNKDEVEIPLREQSLTEKNEIMPESSAKPIEATAPEATAKFVFVPPKF